MKKVLLAVLAALLLFGCISCKSEPEFTGIVAKTVDWAYAAAYFQKHYLNAGDDAIKFLKDNTNTIFEIDSSHNYKVKESATLPTGYSFEFNAGQSEYYLTLPAKEGMYQSSDVTVYKDTRPQAESPYLVENDFYVMCRGVGTVQAASCNGVDGKLRLLTAIITDYTFEGKTVKNAHYEMTEYDNMVFTHDFRFMDSDGKDIHVLIRETGEGKTVEEATYDGSDFKASLTTALENMVL